MGLWDQQCKCKCGYEGKAKALNGGYCVIDYYCPKCGEWLWDKDVS